MIHLRRQSLVAYEAPLCETIVECPAPRGSEVLVRIARCGVCHSDLHMQDGYFKLAGDKRLDITAGRSLPFTLGHEIAGTIEAAGPDVAADASAAAGREVAVYPWIGCSSCAACRHGDENLCAAPRHLGIAVDGGYASHVLVPHPRYLLDYAPLTAAQAGTLMCSGLTAFAALKRLTAAAARGPVLLVGLGGVGMMGLGLARTLFASAPLAADIDAGKRAAALAAGAAAVFDPADSGARKAVMAATGGGAYGVCDFVGSDASLGFATFFVNRSRHDSDLAFAGRNDAGTIWADQPRAPILQELPGFDHVERRNAFGDADDEIELGVGGFHDGVSGEWWGNENYSGVGAGFFHGFLHGVENWPAFVGGASLARSDSADDLRAVRGAGFGVESAFSSGEALHD